MPTEYGSCWIIVLSVVCVFVYPHVISKNKLSIEMFHNWVSETDLFWCQTVKDRGQGHKSQKPCRRGSLHSCECWLFL